jgi:hypothetical protein
MLCQPPFHPSSLTHSHSLSRSPSITTIHCPLRPMCPQVRRPGDEDPASPVVSAQPSVTPKSPSGPPTMARPVPQSSRLAGAVGAPRPRSGARLSTLPYIDNPGRSPRPRLARRARRHGTLEIQGNATDFAGVATKFFTRFEMAGPRHSRCSEASDITGRVFVETFECDDFELFGNILSNVLFWQNQSEIWLIRNKSLIKI